MSGFFAQLLNMSLTGSVVIAVVLLVRHFMKRLPKIAIATLFRIPLTRTAAFSM